MPYSVGVLGPGDADDAVRSCAEEVGRLLAQSGATLFCGGLGGVMEAAAKGAKEAGGLTVGILPGDKSAANRFIDVAVATGVGEARNAILVRSCHAVIAIGGAFGTLSEIALALKMGVPVVTLKSWSVTPPGCPPLPLPEAQSPQEAVSMVLSKVAENHP